VRELLLRIAAYLDISERRQRDTFKASRYVVTSLGAGYPNATATLIGNALRTHLYLYSGSNSGDTDVIINPLFQDARIRIFPVQYPVIFSQETHGELIKQEFQIESQLGCTVIVIERISIS